ncbi:MAG: hypothetical protein ACYTEL_14905 [Planctomycetota bacterium]|jgi:hypothetical protein
MVHIVVACLLGGLVGFFCAIYVFGARTWGREGFLRRCSLTVGVTIAAPIVAYFTLFQDFPLKEWCLAAYFLSLLLTLIMTIAFIGWLAVSSLAPGFIPPRILRPYHRLLLLTFFFSGYPGVREKLQALIDLVERASTAEFNPGDLSEDDRKLCDELKLSPYDLRQICDAAGRFLQ